MWQVSARFCPLCGAGLAPRTIGGRERKACTACRFVLYAGPAAAAAAVIVNARDEVLLVERDLMPFEGEWALPAGYQELDESPAECLVREVAEEAGLAIEVGPLVDVLFVPDDPRKPANVAIYLAVPREPTAVPMAGDDARAARWFPRDGLPSGLPFDNNRVIERAFTIRDHYPRGF